MKKEIIFGVIGGIALLILTGYYAGKYSGTRDSGLANSPLGSSVTNPVANSSASITLTASEIAKHASRSDCWIIVNGSVYGVSGYLNSHPGGAAIIIPYCGRDATAAYDTKGGRGMMHSGMADQDLRQLLIGTLGSAVNATTVQNANNVRNFSGGDDD